MRNIFDSPPLSHLLVIKLILRRRNEMKKIQFSPLLFNFLSLLASKWWRVKAGGVIMIGGGGDLITA